MSTAVSASMQAALLIREKQRLRRKQRIRRGLPARPQQLPSHVATKDIAPFPRYPPYPPNNLNLQQQIPQHQHHHHHHHHNQHHHHDDVCACADGQHHGNAQWCSQGRAAWQERERERRGSLSEAANSKLKQTEAHLRWMKRNRIHDATYGGSSDEEDILGGLYGQQSAAANALLYVGLGTVAIGLVISFVGTGEKGFKTLELRLIGPSLIGCGLVCCLVRILLCACPSPCFRRRKRKRCSHHSGGSIRRYRDAEDSIHMADHSTSLIRKQTTKKRVSIAAHATTAKPTPSTSSGQQQCNNIATTSLFLQNEREKNFIPKLIPKIAIPHVVDVNGEASELNLTNSDFHNRQMSESIIELQNIEYDNHDVSSVSSRDSVDENTTICNVEVNTKVRSKINRRREPLNAQQFHKRTTSTVATTAPDVMETSLTIAPDNGASVAMPETSGVRASESFTKQTTNANKQRGEIVLSPSKLGQ